VSTIYVLRRLIALNRDNVIVREALLDALYAVIRFEWSPES